MPLAEAGITADDKRLFGELRDDIAAHPEKYRRGFDYLSGRFSAEALQSSDMKDWEQSKNDPTHRSSNDNAARWFASHSLLRREVQEEVTELEFDRMKNDFLDDLRREPQNDYPLSRQLIIAFRSLLAEGLGTPDDDLRPIDPDKAPAVLILTWLLTDKYADRHPLAMPYGPWGEDDAEKLALKGRAIARGVTLDDKCSEREPGRRGPWMDLVIEALKALPGLVNTPAPANELPIEVSGAPQPAVQSAKHPRRRGRPIDTDPEADRRIYEAWETGNFKTYADLGRELNMQKRDIGLAIDRQKKRNSRGTN